MSSRPKTISLHYSIWHPQAENLSLDLPLVNALSIHAMIWAVWIIPLESTAKIGEASSRRAEGWQEWGSLGKAMKYWYLRMTAAWDYLILMITLKNTSTRDIPVKICPLRHVSMKQWIILFVGVKTETCTYGTVYVIKYQHWVVPFKNKEEHHFISKTE